MRLEEARELEQREYEEASSPREQLALRPVIGGVLICYHLEQEL